MTEAPHNMPTNTKPALPTRSEPFAPLPRFGGTATRLTSDVPGIGGELRAREEDFLVEEIPLYTPSGEGEHIYLMIEKRGLSTLEARHIIAKHFGVPKAAVGLAGLKDKRAITRQVFSVHTPGRGPDDYGTFEHPQMAIMWVDLHDNKLRRGHLVGNRFSIRVRGVRMTDALRADRVMRTLAASGVPDRYGPQRFGYLGNNAEVGRSILCGEHAAALRHMLGVNPHVPTRHDDARRDFEAGRYQQAADGFPRSLHPERQALRVLASGGDATKALRAMDRTTIEFYLSSIQSEIFNRVLDRRVREGTLAELFEGDIAVVHGHRARFAVTAEELAKADTPDRLKNIEISASGPMWSATMTRCAGAADDAEIEALESVGLSIDTLDAYAASRMPWALEGSRRPLRVPVENTEVEGGIDEHGEYVRCAFELPAGAFATTVMDEIMKPAESHESQIGESRIGESPVGKNPTGPNLSEQQETHE